MFFSDLVIDDNITPEFDSFEIETLTNLDKI